MALRRRFILEWFPMASHFFLKNGKHQMAETRKQYQLHSKSRVATTETRRHLTALQVTYTTLAGEGDCTWFLLFCDDATHDLLVEKGYPLVLDEDSLTTCK